MATSTATLSLTRPRDPEREGASSPWQFSVGLAVALMGLMSLMVLFVISAVVAGWVQALGCAEHNRVTTNQLGCRKMIATQ